MKYVIPFIGFVLTVVFASGCGNGQSKSADLDKIQKAMSEQRNVISEPQQALTIHLKLNGGKFGSDDEAKAFFALEQVLEGEIDRAKVGDFDGNEIGEGEGTYFIYGPSADILFSTIETKLRSSPLSKGGYAIKRYGGADEPKAKEVRIDF